MDEDAANDREFELAVPGDLEDRGKLLEPGESVHGEWANFTSLALGCLEADFRNQILVGMKNLAALDNKNERRGQNMRNMMRIKNWNMNVAYTIYLLRERFLNIAQLSHARQRQ